jgi:triosephosphate isomerase
MARALIVGNWKSYVASLKQGKKLFKDIEKTLPRTLKSDVVVCPPSLLLQPLASAYRGQRIEFGVQDTFPETGAHTGEVSVVLAKDVGARYTIVGHAERRAQGETDEVVAREVGAALDIKLIPIVAFGEKERDRDGHYLKVLQKSIETSLSKVQERDMKKLVIAYEPVWAIGAALPPDARTVQETVIFIRKVLAGMFDRNVALKARIIYGGAVDDENALELMQSTGVSGFLLGRASVDAQKFTRIVSLFQ